MPERRVGPGRADMGGCAKAGWAAAALGVLGLLCAVLGAVMIVSVPSLIREQILKVGAGARAPGGGGGGAGGLGAGRGGGARRSGAAPLPTAPPVWLRVGAPWGWAGGALGRPGWPTTREPDLALGAAPTRPGLERGDGERARGGVCSNQGCLRLFPGSRAGQEPSAHVRLRGAPGCQA